MQQFRRNVKCRYTCWRIPLEEGAQTLRMGEIFFFRRNTEKMRQGAENRIRTCMHRGTCTFSCRTSVRESDFTYCCSFQRALGGKFFYLLVQEDIARRLSTS